MRNKYIHSFLFVAAFLFPTISFSQLAFYPFAGNAIDLSGNNHHGTVNGATLTTDRNGNANNAYSFNGSQNIQVPYHADFDILPSGQYTISLWVKPASYNSNARALFVKCNYSTSAPTSMWDYGIYLITNNTIMIGYHSTHVCFSNTHLLAGQWYCVTATYNNGDWKIYINGTLDAQVLNSGLYILQSLNGIGIGCKGQAPLDFFDGQLDDIRFYNRALAVTEISALCSSSPLLPVSNFIASDSVFCFSQSGNCVNFTNHSLNATSRQWLFPGASPASDTTLNPSNVCYPSSGIYIVTLISVNSSGTDTATNTITIVPTPSVSLILSSNQYCINAPSVTLSGGSPTGGIYSGTGVSAGSFNPALAGAGSHPITYSYTNAGGCSDTATSIEVSVIPSVEDAFLPNAFSPNGDSKNDDYSIDSIQDFEMRIFNRWGEELIVLNQSKRFWDGTYHDQQVPTGVYFYILQGTNCNAEGVERKGTISLFR